MSSKKDSDRCRLILDLSLPEGNAINDGIDKDIYLGEEEKLVLPSIDSLAERVMKLGVGCKLFKVDLRRGYCQIFLCPGSIHWVGFVFDGKFYFDTTLSMGSRSSTRCCQMVTSAVVFIYTNWGYFAINYLDDIGSAETEEKAEEAYIQLRNLLARFELQEALEKSVAPTTFMVFLGIQVNSLTLTLSIPEDKWKEILNLLRNWEFKTKATLKETQQLTGTLNFACRCVKSGRVYLLRILNFLRSLPKTGSRVIPKQVRVDISWWIKFAPKFNGVSLMTEIDWSDSDELVSSDSCLSGGGAFNSISQEFVAWKYPKQILELGLQINELECLMVVVMVKLWGAQLARKKLTIQCDNMSQLKV